MSEQTGFKNSLYIKRENIYNEKAILFIGFAILACSEEDVNTSADSGIFYETHGGKLFASDEMFRRL